MKRFSSRIEVIVFVSVFVAVAVFILAFGPVVQLDFVPDISVIFDGAWRLQNHQVPHIDFPSILGYAFLYQQYIFLKLFNYDIFGIVVSSVVFAGLMICIYMFFYRSKTFIANSNFLLRLYIFLLIISLALGQYNLGWFVAVLTYGGLYNRYCFECLLLVILMLLLLAGQKVTIKKDVFFILVISILLNYLLFSKITFFIVAAGVIFLFLIFKYITFHQFKFLLLFSLVVFAGFLLFSHENFFSILMDYRKISSVRGSALVDRSYVFQKFYGRYNIILLLGYAFLLFQLILKKVSLKLIVLLLFVGVMSIFIHFTNFGYYDIVLLTFIPCLFILADFVPFRKLLSFKLMLLLCFIFITKNVRSIALVSTSRKQQHNELKNKYIKQFYTWYFIPRCNIQYSSRQENGVELINKNIRSGEKIMSFTFDNFFPLLTHTVPPKNNLLVWHNTMTYSDSIYPAADPLFADVNLLLIPTCEEWDSSMLMKKIYAKTISEKFIKIDESKDWILYRKKA